MSHHHSDGARVEEWVFSLVIAGIVLLVAVPFLFWKAVESNPTYYQTLRTKDLMKGAGWGLLVASVISLSLVLFPSLGKWPLFQLGHFKFQLGIVLSWLVANLVLGSIAFLSLPFWRSFVRSKHQMKDQLY